MDKAKQTWEYLCDFANSQISALHKEISVNRNVDNNKYSVEILTVGRDNEIRYSTCFTESREEEELISVILEALKYIQETANFEKEHNDFICYRKVSGWTHDWPALIYSFTDISLFFYDENTETVENVENEAGIDAYEDRVGYFCVRPEDYVLAMNQIEDHDVRGVEH